MTAPGPSGAGGADDRAGSAGAEGAGGAGAEPDPDRVRLLTERLAALRARIDRACAAAGRDPAGVDLLAVTKTVPAADVAALIDLGLLAFGENRVQEAGAKVDLVARLRPAAEPRWHLVGGLQRNKARSAVRWADRVESVDSGRLADALDAAVRRLRETGGRATSLPVLLQFSVDGDPARGGVADPGLLPLAEHVAGCAGLRLSGLMAVAPLGAEPARAFAAVAAAADRLRNRFPQATVLSAGMSQDLEIAIEHGSTVLRVGTALLGERPLASP